MLWYSSYKLLAICKPKKKKKRINRIIISCLHTHTSCLKSKSNRNMDKQPSDCSIMLLHHDKLFVSCDCSELKYCFKISH